MTTYDFADGKMGLWVPLNEQGMVEYEYCNYDSEFVIFVELPNSERDVLYYKGCIKQFNTEFGLIISEWEIEDIKTENLKRAREIVSPYADKLPTFLKYLDYAIEHNTFISISW